MYPSPLADLGFVVLGVLYAFTVTSHLAVFPFCVLAVIVVVPPAFAVIFPFVSTVATFVLDDVHVIFLSVAFIGLVVTFKVAVFLLYISSVSFVLSNFIDVGYNPAFSFDNLKLTVCVDFCEYVESFSCATICKFLFQL